MNVGVGMRRDLANSRSGSLSNGSSTEEKAPSKARFLTVAIGKLVLGTGVCAIFSDPMVDAVSNFSGVRIVFSCYRRATQATALQSICVSLPLPLLHA